jgi:hypothetical protein
MKKVLSFVAIAAMAAFVVSCGDDEAEKKRKEDSARAADSMAMVASEIQRKADSAHVADSVKNANDMAEMKRKADSAHMADSIAAKKGGKAKTPAQKVKEENKKATGGRG